MFRERGGGWRLAEVGLNIDFGRLDSLEGGKARRQKEVGPASKEALRLRLYLALILIDSLALILGFAAGNVVRFGTPIMAQGFNMCLMLLPIYLGTAINSRAYGMQVLTSHRLGMFRAITSLLFAVAAVTFLAFYLRSSLEMSRIVLGAGAACAGLLMLIGRKLMAIAADRWFGGSPLSEVVIKDGRDCEVAPGAFLIEARAMNLRPDIADPMMLDRMGRLLKNADRVVVACPPEQRARWALALKGANITGELIVAEVDDLGAIGTGRYVGQSTLRISAGPLGLRDRIIKRLLDLSVAIPALILLSPLFLIVAAAIRYSSPGPVFFVQERLGRGNRLFKIYKFRSMRADRLDDAGHQSTLRDDDRITPVGRLIRKTSVDELPQILNVIRGEMSLVGPRPHALGSTADNALFWEVDSRYWLRHASKPGLTGLAQVRGFRGATHCRSDLTNRLQADLEYMSGWSVWRDISIIIATFKVLVHRNAF
jgi:lipopolysaccharide/colanic/teichoic acid biosynthesis glycosyltransferase